METNEIMNNEKVIETAEEIVTSNSGKTLKMSVGIGLGIVAAIVAYKYVVKPVIANIKAKKEQQTISYKVIEEEEVPCDFEETEEEYAS